MTLFFAFKAFGIQIYAGVLSAGFAVGQATTLIPILPGGFGAMEGSMAAVFEGLGVRWEGALVAVLIFRACYYVIPGLTSVFVLWGLKMSEPDLIRDTVMDTLPEELLRKADELERKSRRQGQRKL